MKTTPAKTTLPQARPFTGAEYLDSLRDDREVWIYGERVKDVTKHPAFRNSARSIARLYDAFHDPVHRDVLTTETDTGNKGLTHPFFRAPHSREDLIRSRDAIAAWQRLTFGCMGRSPDYKASFLATLGANAEFYAPYQENARRWYRDTQERVMFLNHAIVHPPVDRNRPADEVADICVHVEKETDQGLIVSGAKVVATGSHPLQLRRALRPADEEKGIRRDLHGADERARVETHLPTILRNDRRARRQSLRLPAVEPL